MNKFGKVSIVTSSLVLPLTTLISGLVGAYLKSNNPNNVDITSNMAYLKQILGATLIVFVTLWVLSLLLALIGLKKDTDSAFSKLSLIILPLILIVSIAAGMATNAAGDAEDTYRNTVRQEFLENLEKLK
jgi:putative copper export protein